MTQFLSEYFDHKENIRKAVIRDEDGFIVELWEHDQLIEIRDVRHKSYNYAKDCAENWVEGIIK